MDKYKVLQEVFGHEQFRSFQEEAVDTILAHQDLLTILPTGGGKSLCYQLPSLLMRGMSVVISPLIALMQDQVLDLQEMGIKAYMLNSACSAEEINKVYQAIHEAEIQLLYIAPERLFAQGFLQTLKSVELNFFVIDEAHCLSEWGHEFRGDYRRLSCLKEHFPNVPIVAFTATATQKVQEDIIRHLSLETPKLLRGKTVRTNLHLEVQKRLSNWRTTLLLFLEQHKNECGIIYTFTRKEAENLALFLAKQGFRVKAYHAGLENHIRQEVFEAFVLEEVEIVVATVAFGMGIDKSNIRFVVHTSMPKTMENYYQEVGRAGRDGLDAVALLFYIKADEIQRKVMMQDLEEGEYKNILFDKLLQMYRYCVAQGCRHKLIAKYFEDEIVACETRCDNCLQEEQELKDISTEAQKFLSTLYRCEQRFGAGHLIDVLRGMSHQKILQFGHERLSVYGIGKETSKSDWSAIVDRLFELECMDVGEFKALKLTQNGLRVLKGDEKVFINPMHLGTKEKKRSYKGAIKVENEAHFEALRSLRNEIAKENSVPAYIVFSDKTLVELSQELPINKEQMLAVNGVGLKKYERYGDAFLELCEKLRSS